MKQLKLIVIAAFFLISPLTVNAQSMASFELECTDCLYWGTGTASWETPLDATQAAGFFEDSPGYFFRIDLPEYLNAPFWAHSEDYPGGYNFFDPLTGNWAAMRGGETIFKGPTSAPVWRCGEYEHTVNYFTNIDQGQAKLTISGANDEDCDGVVDDDDFCPDTVIPESVPTSGALKPNQWALTDDDGDFDTVIKGEGKGPNRSYTIEDTAGCSCEQIIEIQGLGDGHSKHGCSIGAMDNWVDQVNMP